MSYEKIAQYKSTLLKIARLLKEHNANPALKNTDDQTPRDIIHKSFVKLNKENRVRYAYNEYGEKCYQVGKILVPVAKHVHPFEKTEKALQSVLEEWDEIFAR